MILGVRCVTPETPGRSSTRYFQSLRRPTKQLAHPPQRLADEIPAGGVLPAPGADLHPVVDALVAMGADVLEFPKVPLLGTAAPGAEPHRVHHAAATSPAATAVI